MRMLLEIERDQRVEGAMGDGVIGGAGVVRRSGVFRALQQGRKAWGTVTQGVALG
jgi:hypothetical protein